MRKRVVLSAVMIGLCLNSSFPVYAGSNAITKVSAQGASFDENEEQEQLVGSWKCKDIVQDEKVTPVSDPDETDIQFMEDGTYTLKLGTTVAQSGTWTNYDASIRNAKKMYLLLDDKEDDLLMLAGLYDESDGEGLYIVVGDIMLCCKKVSNETSASVSEEKEDTYSAFATTGEKNALEKAKSYISHSAFSYTGLINQLEYNGYSKSEATYGADHCGADWYEQALAKAKSYISHSAFSYDGLVDQLEYSGFTNEQAVYGVKNCGADWYEQAKKKAESYLSHMSFSKSELIDQLEYSGFTHDQAVYGAKENGY